ncbi:S9 family peptidase [Neolewinella antarctica]|uniref:Dipeptidyl aminopeptidase/acylaminoacyl peptidase n=1 Tax=Neolewinella antarctica TaxID=442734 RepID=A0ABX0X5Y3_9BACT|nr:prolyl oligopeptidase family serine peptidase [Neolewinella antarctica]NJC24615.1 dipeptidyl aminopeptidase/acylaminoacyl peptidase [Neolewinella antarctica]
MRRLLPLLLPLLLCTSVSAQDALGYQTPPDDILKLVDVPLAPSVLMDKDKKMMVLIYRDAYKSIADLSQTELRLGGLRIDPQTNIGSRVTYYNSVAVGATAGGTEVREVTGLPEKPRLTNFNWSPDYRQVAMTHTTAEGVEVWLLDVATGAAQRVTNAAERAVNANMGDVINWAKDGKSMLVKFLPQDRKSLIDGATAVPTGPTISTADGKKAQNRTYQDLLKNPNDEHNFEQLARSEIHRVYPDGRTERWLPTDMYRNLSYSPDGAYVMVSHVQRPFSYLVPYYRFPTVTTVYDQTGKVVRVVNDVPLIEDLPKGFMATEPGRRNVSWRADKAAELTYVQALDEGDPANEVDFRDEVFTLSAPFAGEGKSILKTTNRYAGIAWGNDNTAVAYDRWWDTRNTKTYVFNPSDADQSPKVLFDRNYQDRYSDPGSPVYERNEYGRSVLALDGDHAFMLGDGYTENGQYPFLHKIDLSSGDAEELYVSKMEGKVEDLQDFDPKTGRLQVRIESPVDYPNYYFRDVNSGDMTQITNFENPFAALGNVHKEVITYAREDGLELTGTLYLPVGYDKEKKEKMPMILWAYPREFKDKASAAQNTSNPNEFIYPYYGSPVYWVTRGYVVLDDAAFPIVGEGDTEPNDSFRKQLVANGKAAIDAVDALGYIDRERVAVGGHSYGAFMVANLLSHSDLFAAGIARSGAYNRTLTPFGFQSEQRSYWEAPAVYNTMSPFMHAEKMKTPLLLVHGEADNNSGTYPLQSERYFNALKGLGATVRLVMLPKESHGYRAKESILHLLWEQDQWMEKWVKNKGDIRP